MQSLQLLSWLHYHQTVFIEHAVFVTEMPSEKRSLDDDGSVGTSTKRQKLAGTQKCNINLTFRRLCSLKGKRHKQTGWTSVFCTLNYNIYERNKKYFKSITLCFHSTGI